MKEIIIGIAGELNSGKDTVASMLNYIHEVGTGRANYREWITRKDYYDLNYKHRVISYGDNLKKVLSIMFNINLDYFYDRDYKDNKVYCLSEKRFIDNEDLTPQYYVVDILMLRDKPLNHYLYVITSKKVVFSLRTLLQYFGTEIGRNQIYSNIWIESTIFKAVDIATTEGICLIPDVRFKDENYNIHNLRIGYTIKLIRDTNNTKEKHDSEIIDFDCHYTINNNDTKTVLFFKVLHVYQQIVKQIKN